MVPYTQKALGFWTDSDLAAEIAATERELKKLETERIIREQMRAQRESLIAR